MAFNPQNARPLAVSFIGTVSTAGTYPLCYLPKKFVLTGAVLLDQVGIAESDTNYVTLTLKNGSTALGTLDSRAANQGAVTALVAKQFEMTSDEQELAAGSSLSLTYAEGGSGTTTLAQVQLLGYML